MNEKTGKSQIIIKGAKEHNLKNIDVTIPRNSFTVVTGVSGSGKSSLAFDTLYAEGQRRYVESLSSYARQFLGLMKKPNVDYIEGLSPAISIEQKKLNRNPRSTVGTITELYDYLRLLFAHIGEVYCYNCNEKIQKQTIDQVMASIFAYPENTKIIIYSPIAVNKKGTYAKDFESLKKEGFHRVRVDGNMLTLDETIELEKNEKHTIEVVIDRVILSEDKRKRIFEAVEQGLGLGKEKIIVAFNDEEKLYSTKFSCPHCDISYPDITPSLLSFNAPQGACEACHGIGYKQEFDLGKIFDLRLSIKDNAILPYNYSDSSWFQSYINGVCKTHGIPLGKPLEKLTEQQMSVLIHGSDKELTVQHDTDRSSYSYKTKFPGLLGHLYKRYEETNSDEIKEWLEKYMKESVCTVCEGKRLNKFALSIKIQNKNIIEFTHLNVKEAIDFIKNIQLSETQKTIVKDIMKEINARLSFLNNVGLSYITLERKAFTLSGGEAQRINLATQIGSQLTGVLYVLDEPTIGLHQRDNEKLIHTLKELQEIGNTLVIVEHDKQIMNDADYIIDLGPKAGTYGGEVMFQGTKDNLMKSNTLTAQYLKEEKKIAIPSKIRKGNGKLIELKQASLHNLKNIDVTIPLNTLTVVTGVSGSGKSSLIIDLLYPIIANTLHYSKDTSDLKEMHYKSIKGIEAIYNAIHIDQSPIGRTPRSNPATYTKVFDSIRDLFSTLPESKTRGFKAGRFSFNVKGGRCENCKGDGLIKIEMHFLPDVYVTCDVCEGKRFNTQTLDIRYKGKNISEVLDLSIDDAYDFFEAIPSISRKLRFLKDVGLGYLTLGQSATTLSGGEAQRLKLTRELSKVTNRATIYFLDEPTTGLHFDDIAKLVDVLQKLVDKGNTIIVIEHNLDLLKCADYVIDLGPEGGEEGGEIVFQGFMNSFLDCKNSYTAYYIKKELSGAS